MAEKASAAGQIEEEIASIEETLASVKEELKAKKAEHKALEKEIAKLEEQKAAFDAAQAEAAKKAELESVLHQLMADGMSAGEILEKLK
ncbi:MAG: hypothetical protein ACI4JC_09065 [Faecalibacterium sp.]